MFRLQDGAERTIRLVRQLPGRILFPVWPDPLLQADVFGRRLPRRIVCP